LAPKADENLEKVRPGGIWARIFAYGVDIITCAMVLFPVYIVLSLTWAPIPTWPPVLRLMLDFASVFFVIVLPTYVYGGSPGKLLFDLRLIDSRDGKRPPLLQLFFRETLGRFISTIFLLGGYINALCNRERETWHDLLARTQVIHIQADSPKQDDW